MTTIATSYADTINQQFSKSKSHYVSVVQRLRATLLKDARFQNVLTDCENNFVTDYKQYTKWSDIPFAEAMDTTLDMIVIDTTLQRTFDFMWSVDIVDNFKAINVQPIKVYRDPSCPGKFVCWDGQHTGMALTIIARAMGVNLKDCIIPIVISSSSQKEEMREVFMDGNGDRKKPLDKIDVFHQMVHGVRTDGSTKPRWLMAEQKQQYLENSKLFATHNKFQDTTNAGAVSRLDEIMDERKYDMIITDYFCKFMMKVCKSNRPTQAKEPWMIMDYFSLCEEDASINVTDKYINDVARALKVVGDNDFDSHELYQRAKVGLQREYRKTSYYGDLKGIHYQEKRLGLTFLIEQIKNAGVTVPRYDTPKYAVQQGELF